MLLVALKLADSANDEGENIYPSVGRIERETGLGQSTIRRELAAMEEAGLLEVIEERSGNKWNRSTTIRRFDTEQMRALAETETKRGKYKPSHSVLKAADTGKVDGRGRAVKAWAIRPRNPESGTPPQHGGAGAPATPPPRGGAQEGAAPPQHGGVPLHHVEVAPPPRSKPPTPPYKDLTIIEPSSRAPACAKTDVFSKSGLSAALPKCEPRFNRKLPLPARITTWPFGESQAEADRKLHARMRRFAKGWDLGVLKGQFCTWMVGKEAPADAIEAFAGWLSKTAPRRVPA